jgi:hypothetical protein
MLLNKTSILLALLIGLSACSKKENVLSQREMWLSTGGWRMTNYTYSTRPTASSNSIQLEYITGQVCEADDLYRFEAANRLQWDKNGTPCSASQPALTEWGTWQLLNSDTKLAIDHQGSARFPYTYPAVGPLNIVELTAEKMVLKTNDVQIRDSVIAYTYRFIKE